MKNVQRVLVPVFFLMVLFALAGYGFVGYLRGRTEVEILEIKVEQWLPGSVVIYVNLELTNPHPHPIQIDSLHLQVFAGKTFLGSQMVDKTLILLPHRSRKVEVYIRVFLGGLGEAITAVLSERPIPWEVKGTIYKRALFGRLPYPFRWKP